MPDTRRRLHLPIGQEGSRDFQPARTDPLVIRSRDQTWSTLRGSMGGGVYNDETPDILLLHEAAVFSG